MAKTKDDQREKKKRKTSSEAEKQKSRKKNQERMRKVREAMRNNPEAYEAMKRKERERYYKRVQEGKIKKISDLDARSQRKVRKVWKQKSKKSREAKMQREESERPMENSEDTPPGSPQTPVPEGNSSTSHQKDSGRKRSRKHQTELKSKIVKLEEKIKTLEAKCNKYKVRCCRNEKAKQKINKSTPRKTVEKLLVGSKVTEQVRKELIFGEVLKTQIHVNFETKKSLKEKQILISSVNGEIVQKYKYSTYVANILQRRRKSKKMFGIKQRLFFEKRKAVREFLERDENSRLCAGKKECITKKKEKKQRRYLTNTMTVLLPKYNSAYPNLKMTYSTFCSLRPFWIVKPPIKRETCLCSIHENMELLVAKMKQLKLIEQNSPQNIIRDLCCLDYTADCLLRKCSKCKNKTMKYFLDGSEENDDVTYEKWVVKKELLAIKGKEKVVKKTKKVAIMCKKKSLMVTLEMSLNKYFNHVNNIIHQYKQINKIKENLLQREIFIHMDFSENYQTKYNREIQSAHFGGSKHQISLHTVVVYYKPIANEKIKTWSYCTVSEDLRHDATAICTHLSPVLADVKSKIPDITTVHFLSDGPTTQYRNKYMFYLMGTYLTKVLGVENLFWHYSESGHGKGAPDGIGGCLKRMADVLVAQSEDITNKDKFITILQKHCSGINILPINEIEIDELHGTLPRELPSLKGTMMVHEIAWTKLNKNILQARRLTCLQCKDGECNHYPIGVFKLNYAQPQTISKRSRLHYKQVYSDSSEDEGQTVQEDLVVTENSFVVVRFTTSKCLVHHYIGLVQSVNGNEFTINFLRRSGTSHFVFPPKEDVAVVEKETIVLSLKQPVLNNRGKYLFSEDLLFSNLN